ncbi:MAG: rRNA maturation RNase YbeY [Planctomycetes bacterium]|nr:rRNA maturation RNase YbeY [Planctomycetota bacterium]MCW8135366.1 rRNA maturation RNase YbeY [Planctomycetota bacterium]
MIDVAVHSTLHKQLPVRLLARAARAALQGRLKRANVSVLLVGAARMRTLNRDALGHDYVTDVLSFDHGQTPEGRLIEIFVCPDFARQQSKLHDVSLEQELARYVVHGCLHCAGFDDRTEQQRKRLWQVQESVLRNLFKAK